MWRSPFVCGHHLLIRFSHRLIKPVHDWHSSLCVLRGCPWRRPELSAESVPGAATTVGAHKLQPCVLELCKFFSQCLCRPFSHKTRMKRSANSPCCLQTAPLQTAVWIVLLLSVASLISLSCCTSLGGHNKPRQCKAQTHTGRQKLQGEAFWSILNKNEWLTSFVTVHSSKC